MSENKYPDNASLPPAPTSVKIEVSGSKEINDEFEFDEVKFNLDFGDLGDFFCEGNSIFTFSEELGISNATK